MITIYVLTGSDLFAHVLNGITSFMKQDGFLSLLKIITLFGIIFVTCSFIKNRNPIEYVKWFLAYMLLVNVALIPKTTVLIYDTSHQAPKIVDNVPSLFAITASLLTTIGYGLAQSYDSLLSLPDDLTYTKTGALFGARLVQASREFRIIDPQLKEEMNIYFRNCVVGDIRINHKYSVSDITNSTNIWPLISKRASPLRMTLVNGKAVTCLEASKKEGECSLYKKFEKEITNAYSFFGINLFGKPINTTYEKLFNSHLTSAFSYYQGLSDSSSNIFLQSMMINALNDGASSYKTFTNATAGIINQQFSKSQLQHRWSWQIAGVKSLWFLPLLHTLLTLLLFGVFPLIIMLTTFPGGIRILYSYFQFFLSLQFWPVMFAILNAAMTFYGQHKIEQYGGFTLVNIDKIDELHSDISGVAGYMMMLIPFLANGLISNLSAAFNGLATSMTGHVQGSTMAVAGEAASGSFGIGQTSFYNTTANNFSANKHDSNWTNMHGLHTEQLGSGVLKTMTSSGNTVFDTSHGMSRLQVSTVSSEGLSASLNEAYEHSKQAASNESINYQNSLSSFAHKALQLSELQGHDMRLGDNVSSSESAQYSKALNTVKSIATDVAKRYGVSTEDALTHLTNVGWGTQSSLNTAKSIPGKLAEWGIGFNGGGESHFKFDRSSNATSRYNAGHDEATNARETRDFNNAMNTIKNFTQNHSFDESTSEAQNLSHQMGTDLRTAETASHNFDAALSQSERIQNAKSYVETHGSQISTDLNQAFVSYVGDKIGEHKRDELFANTSDLNSLHQLEELGSSFLESKRDALIAEFGNRNKSVQIDNSYQESAESITNMQGSIKESSHQQNSEISELAIEQNLGIDQQKANDLKNKMSEINKLNSKIETGKTDIKNKSLNYKSKYEDKKTTIRGEATNGVIPFHALDNALEFVNLKNKRIFDDD